MTLEQLLILAFIGHFVLIASLYVWLTIERQVAVVKKEVKVDAFVKPGADPARSMRVARNLSNQFELPMFALFAALFIYESHEVILLDVIGAWLFLAGRVIHTAVQTLTQNVPLRGVVFTLNFIGVVMLMVHVTCILLHLGGA